MSAWVDLAGLTFGRLTAISFVRRGRWIFECACGTRRDLLVSNVRSGRTASCGCSCDNFSYEGGCQGHPMPTVAQQGQEEEAESTLRETQDVVL